MVSKEEYHRYIDALVAKDKDNENIGYLSSKYRLGFSLLLTFGIIFFIGGVFCTSFPNIETILGIILMILGFVFCMLSIVMFFKSSKVIKYYKDNYRASILDYLLKGYEYSFSSNEGIEENIFKDSGFAGYYEDYDGSDKLRVNIPNDDGSNSGCYLTLCDLDVTKTERDSDGDSRTVTVYNGVFGYVEFPFEFKCILSIDSFYRKKGIKLERVNLEDIKFNNKFKVYSEDQVESRYILTPDMMDKLMNLEENFKGLKITIVNNKMYIGATGINLFELSSIKDGNVSTLFENFYDEIKVILDIINEIKNNDKVFKM